MFNLWSSPVRIIVAIALLYRELQAAAFVALGILVLMIPVQKKLVGVGLKLFKKSLASTDDRIGQPLSLSHTPTRTHTHSLSHTHTHSLSRVLSLPPAGLMLTCGQPQHNDVIECRAHNRGDGLDGDYQVLRVGTVVESKDLADQGYRAEVDQAKLHRPGR